MRPEQHMPVSGTDPSHANYKQGCLFSEEADFLVEAASADGKEPRPTLFSIGHSTRNVEELFDALAAHRVERLIDIRSFPNSRHTPRFNQPELRDALETRGVEYIWLKQLGGYREGGYLAYTQTEDFAAALEKLDTLARDKRTVCMCAELKWYQCHRRHVADALSDRGWRVIHILDKSRAELHRLKTNEI